MAYEAYDTRDPMARGVAPSRSRFQTYGSAVATRTFAVTPVAMEELPSRSALLPPSRIPRPGEIAASGSSRSLLPRMGSAERATPIEGARTAERGTLGGARAVGADSRSAVRIGARHEAGDRDRLDAYSASLPHALSRDGSARFDASGSARQPSAALGAPWSDAYGGAAESRAAALPSRRLAEPRALPAAADVAQRPTRLPSRELAPPPLQLYR
jgi:hypothetical protein